MSTMIQQNASARRMFVLRVGCWLVTLLVAPLWGGCAKLAPHPDSIPSDLQVTADTLKIAVRDAQRTAAELRAELEQQRKDLADAQVARAQLQGMLRETERRLAEARQVIELQREELASARTERERVAQAVLPLPNRLQEPVTVAPSQAKKSFSDPDGVVSASAGLREQALVSPLAIEEAPIAQPSSMAGDAGPVSNESPSIPVRTPEQTPVVPAKTVVVQNGDTLWRLSRRHKVNLEALRVLNGLSNNLIVAGRTLRLPEPRLQHAAAMQPALTDTLVR